MNKDAIEREVARHGDPVAYMTATAKRIDPEIDEQAFKMLLLMTTAVNCDVECSQATKDELPLMRAKHPIECAVLDYLWGAR